VVLLETVSDQGSKFGAARSTWPPAEAAIRLFWLVYVT
jgi:hypothetical protein